jgi:hypothetical protein
MPQYGFQYFFWCAPLFLKHCSASLQGIEALNKTGKRLEPFLEVELVVNVTKHDVVPRHVVLSSEEKQQVLKQ